MKNGPRRCRCPQRPFGKDKRGRRRNPGRRITTGLRLSVCSEEHRIPRSRRTSGLRLRLPAEVNGRELTHAMRRGDFHRARRAASPQTMASDCGWGIGVGDEKSRDDLPPPFHRACRLRAPRESRERFKGRLDFGGNDLFAARDNDVGGAPEDAD